jgi:prolyl-tRNA editing enzyme YbaK/EbsC (Cys-tRNA(Pro) deacylase)
MNLGTLDFLPIKKHPDKLAPSVATAIATISNTEKVGVAEIDPNLSDTAEFCEHYRIGMDQVANCVILEAKRAEKTWFAACVILGSTRADVNGLARRTLNARKISFAPMDRAVAETGMESGAITPIGLPADWPILIDKAVADSASVIIGSGVRNSKLAVPGSLLTSLPNATIIEGLAHPPV